MFLDSSQFVSFLDLIAFRLQRAGFTVSCLPRIGHGAHTSTQICRLEGGMTPQQRDATIQHFSTPIQRYGGISGLISNSEQHQCDGVPHLPQSWWCGFGESRSLIEPSPLPSAELDRSFNGVHDGFLGKHIHLVEAMRLTGCQWNPSVEYQAMDRIHRLGQHRPVKVVKLVVEDSIEDQVRSAAACETEFAADTSLDRCIASQEARHDRRCTQQRSRGSIGEVDRGGCESDTPNAAGLLT